MSDLIGKKILHYRIVEKLGEGGMGVVYKAEDTKLERTVAIKFLPRQIAASDEERARFKIEAQAAAALNHPNIATIHAIEEHDDEMFIVMEYIGGRELREIIAEKSPEFLKLRGLLDTATQIAAGLQAAHKKGVTHRDIKSANIMVSETGQIKIMDFGLAKISGGAQLTQSGMTLGTVAYMSPEQTQGAETDHRTDIWAFGIVLYEMLTGQLPFRGEYEQAVMYSIMNEEPEFPDEIPANLQQILQKALAKDLSQRYQNVEEIQRDLKTLTGFATPSELQTAKTHAGVRQLPDRAPLQRNRVFLYSGIAILVVLAALAFFLNRSQPIDSIAVLPFVNSNNNPDMEYLSDGLTESLINSLTQLPKLKVMSRSSVFRYKGKEIDPQTAGQELSVRAVLTGRILQRANNLSISTELVDVGDNSQIWGEQYNRKLANIFDVQEEISREISEKLHLKLSGEDQKRLTRRYTDNTEAYQFYLKGRYYAIKYTPEGFKRGVEYFNKAIAIDPNYALAYDGLAFCYYATNWWQPFRKTMTKGRAFAKKALEIDSTLAEAHASLGIINTWLDYDWPAAEREFKRALDLNPNYASAHLWYGFYLMVLGRADESIAELKRAVELDPLSGETNTSLGITLFCAQRYDEAMQQLRTTIELDPNYWLAHLYLARVYEKKGEFPAAIAKLEKTRLMDGAASEVLSALGYAYAVLGKKEEAHKILAELKEQSKRTYVPAYNIATIYAGLGEKDRAFEYLHKEYEEGAYYLNYLKVDPELDSLRSDPRFTALLKKMDLKP